MIRLVHVVAVVIALATPAYPFGPPDGAGGPGGPPRFVGRLFPPALVMRNQDALELTGAQRQTIKGAMVDAERDLVDVRWRVEAEAEKLDTLLGRDPVDEQAAVAQMKHVLGAEAKLKLRHLVLLIRIRNALTPEQRTKLSAARWNEPPPGPLPAPPPE